MFRYLDLLAVNNQLHQVLVPDILHSIRFWFQINCLTVTVLQLAVDQQLSHLVHFFPHQTLPLDFLHFTI